MSHFSMCGLGAAVLVAGLSATACGHAPAAPPKGPTHDIVAEGTADVRVPPDQAVVRLGVEVRAREAELAQQDAAARLQELGATLAALQIPASAIHTEHVQLRPLYTEPTEPGTAPQPAGFAASAVVSIEVQLDPQQLGTRVGLVINRAVAAGVNQIEGVQFGLRDPSEPQARALHEAANEARGKAAVMASSLGAHLGDLLHLSEAGTSAPSPREGLMMARSTGNTTPIEPGELTVRASVQVVYALEQTP